MNSKGPYIQFRGMQSRFDWPKIPYRGNNTLDSSKTQTLSTSTEDYLLITLKNAP